VFRQARDDIVSLPAALFTVLVDSASAPRNLPCMDTDDIAPPPRAGDPLIAATRMDLDPLSVAELTARITLLEDEIVRTRAKIDHATRHRSIADELFKR
jgi:uncharacterized small protein (DUF1192 family)